MKPKKKLEFLGLFVIYVFIFMNRLHTLTNFFANDTLRHSDNEILKETGQLHQELSKLQMKDLETRFSSTLDFLATTFKPMCTAFINEPFNIQKIEACEVAKPCDLFKYLKKLSKMIKIELNDGKGLHYIQKTFDPMFKTNSYLQIAEFLSAQTNLSIGGIDILESKKQSLVQDDSDLIKTIRLIIYDYFEFVTEHEDCFANVKSNHMDKYCKSFADEAEDPKTIPSISIYNNRHYRMYQCSIGDVLVKKIHMAFIELNMILSLSYPSLIFLNNISEPALFMFLGQLGIIIIFLLFPKIPFLYRVFLVTFPRILLNKIFGCGCKWTKVGTTWKMFPEIPKPEFLNTEFETPRPVRAKQKKKRRKNPVN